MMVQCFGEGAGSGCGLGDGSELTPTVAGYNPKKRRVASWAVRPKIWMLLGVLRVARGACVVQATSLKHPHGFAFVSQP